jgi:hypothetical protein
MQPTSRITFSWWRGLAAVSPLLLLTFVPLLVIGLVNAAKGHMSHGDRNVLWSGAIGTAVAVGLIVVSPYRAALVGTYVHAVNPFAWTKKYKLIGAGVLVVAIALTPYLVHEQLLTNKDQARKIRDVNAALAVLRSARPLSTAAAITALEQHAGPLFPVATKAGAGTLSVNVTPRQTVLVANSRGGCVVVVSNRPGVTVDNGISHAPIEPGLWHVVYIPNAGSPCDAGNLPTPKGGGVGMFHSTYWSAGPLH